MELISIVCNDLGTLPMQRDITVMKGFLATESVVRFFKNEKRSFFPKRGCNFTFLYHLKRSKDTKRNVRIPSVFSSDQLQENFFPRFLSKKLKLGWQMGQLGAWGSEWVGSSVVLHTNSS